MDLAAGPRMKQTDLNARETAHIIASLRFYGHAAETSDVHPREHPMCVGRLKNQEPMTLDQIEALIGRLDGTWPTRRPRPWDALKEMQ